MWIRVREDVENDRALGGLMTAVGQFGTSDPRTISMRGTYPFALKAD
jgi:hypothetical protein